MTSPTTPSSGQPDPAALLALGLATQAGPARADDTPPPTPAELAPEFPHLDILELLGRGGMGAVYKARQRDLDRLVALKILRPGLDADPGFAERFTREARALAQLNHPGIVTLFEFGKTSANRYFILMEFVDGVNLRQLLAAGRLAPREALAIVPPLCDALQYAHDRGIIHRDIKPENILVDRLGRIKIADFGIAKLSTLPSGDSGHSSLDIRRAGDFTETAGTPAYMAPEQRTTPDQVDHRADLYALGVVLYQMLTGELPAASQLHPPSTRVQLDVRLDEIVLRALEKDPALRYAAASEFKTHLETISQSPASTAPSIPESIPRKTRTRPLPSLFWPATTLLFLITIFCGFIQYAADAFPPQVATHFDLSGKPNMWAGRDASLLLMLGVGLSLPLLIAAAFASLRLLPARFIKLPHRDFWLSPERIAGTHIVLLRSGLILACLVQAWFCGLQLTLQIAQDHEPAYLPPVLFWTLTVNFVVAFIHWIRRLLRYFKNPPATPPTEPSASSPATIGQRIAPFVFALLAFCVVPVPVDTALKILRSSASPSPLPTRNLDGAATDQTTRHSKFFPSKAANLETLLSSQSNAPRFQFGRTREITLPRSHPVAYDFDQERFVDYIATPQSPRGIESSPQWHAEHGTDVFADPGSYLPGVLFLGTNLTETTPDIWDATADAVASLSGQSSRGLMTFIPAPAAGQPPVTRVYRTPQGGVILVQLLGANDAGDVRLRYKAILPIGSAKLPPVHAPETEPTVFISTIRVNIIGAVNRPGSLLLPANPTLLDALAAAGGWTDAANLKTISILSPSVINTTTPAQPVYHDVSAILAGSAPNPSLADHVTISISERNF